MKNRLLTVSLIIILAFSALTLTAEDNDIRYMRSYIENVDDNIITLTGDLAFKADEHITAISLSPVVFVVENNRPEGFVYIKNRKIDVTLMKKSGGQFIQPAAPQDYFHFTKGKLHQIDELSVEKRSVKFENGKQWYFSDKTEDLKDWKEGDMVIITEPQPGESVHVINARTTDEAGLSKAYKEASVK